MFSQHSEYTEYDKHCYITTNSELIRPSLFQAPRGTTPPLKVHATLLQDLPPQYRGRKKEYHILLGRGAAPLMSQRFRLEFKYDDGIVAWAAKDLFDEFAGRTIKEGGNLKWRISLGRQIHLEADDKDGSRYMTELMDELSYSWEGFWDTIKDDQGVWLTSLQPGAELLEDINRQYLPTPGVFGNQYNEETDSEESADEDILPLDAGGYMPQEAELVSSSDIEIGDFDDEVMFSGDEAVLYKRR